MLTRQVTNYHLLDAMLDAGHIAIEVLKGDDWVADDSSRAALYRLAIETLLEQAEQEGLFVDASIFAIGDQQCDHCQEIVNKLIPHASGACLCQDCTETETVDVAALVGPDEPCQLCGQHALLDEHNGVVQCADCIENAIETEGHFFAQG